MKLFENDVEDLKTVSIVKIIQRHGRQTAQHHHTNYLEDEDVVLDPAVHRDRPDLEYLQLPLLVTDHLVLQAGQDF